MVSSQVETKDIEKEKKKILRLALYTGEIMLRSGAETYRVEDTIGRICRSRNVNYVNSFVSPTVIILADDRSDGFSFVKRIQGRSTDLNKVALLSDFSRDFVEQRMTVDEGLEILSSIDSQVVYKAWLRVLWAGIASAMFSLLFGGGPKDFVCAFFISMAASLCSQRMEHLLETSFMANIVSGILIGALSILAFILGLGSNLDTIIIGSIMPLLPGVALTNGLRDFISGDLLAGLSRVAEAILAAVSIAAGVAIAMKLWLNNGGII